MLPNTTDVASVQHLYVVRILHHPNKMVFRPCEATKMLPFPCKALGDQNVVYLHCCLQPLIQCQMMAESHRLGVAEGNREVERGAAKSGEMAGKAGTAGDVSSSTGNKVKKRDSDDGSRRINGSWCISPIPPSSSQRQWQRRTWTH